MMGMNTYQTGLFSEFLARMYLRCHGFKIVKSRYITGRNTGRAEIDIIARRRNLMIFVEVKCRPSLSGAWDAITATQSARLRRAAENYIAKSAWRVDARFDVIIVCGWRIKWARGAI
ncbi:MAG: YraN family protein [Muribaculaceae bacterium]|nr:YraN family protein [Muribaculaceae bacterium]